MCKIPESDSDLLISAAHKYAWPPMKRGEETEEHCTVNLLEIYMVAFIGY